jgi:hypothetical protein
VVIDVSGAGDFVPKVDIQIRRIKEVYRSVKAGLPWKLPPMIIKDLVAYAVSRINICRTTAIGQNVCPRVLFTGLRVDYRKELSLAFGNYCEVFNGTDNTSRQRSVRCIALYPCCNTTGSWVFFSLNSQKHVRRTIWKKMVTTEDIIKQMNALVDGAVAENLETIQQVLGEQLTPDLVNGPNEELSADPEAEEPRETPSEEPVHEEPTETPSDDPVNQDDVPELEPAGEDESDDEAEDEEEEESDSGEKKRANLSKG